jgi:hypothetical protein
MKIFEYKVAMLTVERKEAHLSHPSPPRNLFRLSYYTILLLLATGGVLHINLASKWVG